MHLFNSLTVSELYNLSIDSEISLVPNIIKGHTVSLLSADPKIGKTALALQMANAVSNPNQNFLDFKTEKCNAVYFSLDDSPSNMKDRLNRMGIQHNSHLRLVFSKDVCINDLSKYISQIKIKDPKLGFVVIDMLNDIRKIDSSNEYSNAEIKSDIKKLREIATNNKLSILVLHHNGKKEYSNKNNKALGGIQLTGTINGSILSIFRTSTQSKMASLEISGRNVPSKMIPLYFDESLISFIPAEKESIDLEKDLVKIINYITSEKFFSGTIQQLSSALKLSTNPAKLGRELNIVQDSFLENGIIIRKRKSNGVRILELSLDPKFDVNGEAIEGSEGTGEDTVEEADPADPEEEK